MRRIIEHFSDVHAPHCSRMDPAVAGWEAVLRIRCSKGIRINSFHGHFFIRSTDLLALPQARRLLPLTRFQGRHQRGRPRLTQALCLHIEPVTHIPFCNV